MDLIYDWDWSVWVVVLVIVLCIIALPLLIMACVRESRRLREAEARIEDQEKS
jgi:hypothetical protein